MAAIGDSWATDSWRDDVWATGSWADSGALPQPPGPVLALISTDVVGTAHVLTTAGYTGFIRLMGTVG